MTEIISTEPDTNDEDPMVVYWQDINYYVSRSSVDKMISRLMGHQQVASKRKVLYSVYGSFVAGQMTAIMGKSMSS